jgi:RNA polymerase sigma-70 factor, ECF subfamily
VERSPDPELIAHARKGSMEAAGALFDRYWPSAWAAAYAVTADRSAADDAAQEAIQQAFGALDRFDTTRPFGPWLKRIAVNRAIDHLRRARRVTVL